LGEPSNDARIAENVALNGKFIASQNELKTMKKQLDEKQIEITRLNAALSEQARKSKEQMERWQKWHKEQIENLVRVYEEKITKIKKGQKRR